MIIYEGEIKNKRYLSEDRTYSYTVKFYKKRTMTFISDMDIDKNSQIIIKHYDNNNSTIGRENIIKYPNKIPSFDNDYLKENFKLYIQFKLSRFIENFTKSKYKFKINNLMTQEYPDVNYINLYKNLICSNTQISELKGIWQELFGEINAWSFKKEPPTKDRIYKLRSTFDDDILCSSEFLKVFENPLIEIILDKPKFSKFSKFRSEYFSITKLFTQLSYTMYICEFYLNNHDGNNNDKKYFKIRYGGNNVIKKIYWKQTQLINLIRNTRTDTSDIRYFLDKEKMSDKWLDKYKYVKELNDKSINKSINKLIDQHYLIKSNNEIYCGHIYNILTDITRFLKYNYKKKNPITFDTNHEYLNNLYTEQKKIFNPESNIWILEGYPGTGKSHTVTSTINYLCEKGHSCLILGPTGISVNNVRNGISNDIIVKKKNIQKEYIKEEYQDKVFDKINNLFVSIKLEYIEEEFLGELNKLSEINIFTIHKQTCSPSCYYENHSKKILNQHDVLIIDEAGMIGSKTFSKFIDMCNKHLFTFKMIIFAGDSNQLPPINDCCHTSILEICKQLKYPKVELTEIKRSDNKNLCIFFKNMANGEITEKDLRKNVTIIEPIEFQNQCFNNNNINKICNNKQLWIAPTNKITDNINLKCQKQKHKMDSESDFWGSHIHFKSKNGKFKSLILQNDKILNKKNIYDTFGDLKLVNGDLGIVKKIKNNKDNSLESIGLKVFKGTKKDKITIELSKVECENIELGYSMTVHKSQGSEADIVYTIIDYDNINSSHFLNIWGTRNLVYTGFTRAKKKVNLVIKEENISKLVKLIQEKPEQLVDIGIDNLV